MNPFETTQGDQLTTPAPHSSRAGRRMPRPRSRLLGGAAACGAVMVALGGTAAAAASTPSPAKAVREHNGTVVVHYAPGPGAWLTPAEDALARIGVHEGLNLAYSPGPAVHKGAIACPAMTGRDRPAAGQPKIWVLFGDDGTARIGPVKAGGPARYTHISDCNTSRPTR